MPTSRKLAFILSMSLAQSTLAQACPESLQLAWPPPTTTGFNARAVHLGEDLLITGCNFDGRLRIFEWSGSQWDEIVEDLRSDVPADSGMNGFFVVSDNLMLVSGADLHTAGGQLQVGSLYTCDLSLNPPSVVDRINPPEQLEFCNFGQQIAIDGDWAAVGQRDGDGGMYIHMYQVDGTTLTYHQQLHWETSVILQLTLSDGLLVGSAPGQDVDSFSNAGTFETWTLSEDTWSHAGSVSDASPADDAEWARQVQLNGQELFVVCGGSYPSDQVDNIAELRWYSWTGAHWEVQQTIVSPRADGQTTITAFDTFDGGICIAWGETDNGVVGSHVIDWWMLEGDSIEFNGRIDPDGSTAGGTRWSVSAYNGMVASDGFLEGRSVPAQQDRGVFVAPIIDCNENGQFDYCELYAGTATDSNEDGVLDGCPDCDADWNADGSVDTSDLLRLITVLWGTPHGDLNSDGATDMLDLVEMLRAWGDCG
ncbi:MAG: hypothetical protein MK101_01365 [Phycisphaerales bacterium]|nr:hypothetical protein [Phycisphaerales bacterium]